ncbi:MAG TPA: HAMP domain-containing sensor histidine kinase [Nitrososphaeraceae archaeon]|nr:HAMP domain-containing sensor histidine kinase [Nitrososphaeraceae archaeon]
MADIASQESTDEGMPKLKTEELISKTAQLKQSSDSLLAANQALQLKTEELNRSHRALFESNHELALVNKELAATNKQFAETNKRFAEVNKELGVVNHELALANEQIKLHDNMLTDFINIAAHELRTPTQSILGYSELLQQMYSDDDNQQDDQTMNALEAIVRNANRLERLAKDILDVTRIDSHRLILHKALFNLNETIKNVIEDIVTNQIKIKNASSNNNNNIDDDNIQIIFKPKGAKDIPVEADEKKLYQVISNLLTNAVKFTKEGTISITTDTTADKGGEEVIVKVRDTGSGIPAHILPRLFSKFTTNSSEGIGLGLYISKSIIEAHGGRIWAENNSNSDTLKGQKGGGGATFAFSLPNATN